MILQPEQLYEDGNLLFKDDAIDQIIDLQRGKPIVTKIGDRYAVIGGILRYRVNKTIPQDCDVFDIVTRDGIIVCLIPT